MKKTIEEPKPNEERENPLISLDKLFCRCVGFNLIAKERENGPKNKIGK